MRGQLKLEKVHFRLPSLDQKRGVTWNVFSAWGCSWRLLSVWEVAILFRASKQFQRSIPFLSLSHWCNIQLWFYFAMCKTTKTLNITWRTYALWIRYAAITAIKKVPIPTTGETNLTKVWVNMPKVGNWIYRDWTCHAIRRHINDRDFYTDET